MILAGFILLAIGLTDLLRQFLRDRAFWIVAVATAVLLLVVGALGGAYVHATVGVVLAVLWAWLLPLEGRPRISFWPAVFLAVVVVGAVALLPPRAGSGLLGGRWIDTPFGAVGFDLAVLAVGVFAALLETGNVIVRAALLGEDAALPADVTAERSPAIVTAEPSRAEATAEPSPAAESEHGLMAIPSLDPGRPTAPEPATSPAGPDPAPSSTTTDPAFRGGRLIGPLERILVLLLTLFTAYPLLAAMLAAKGIVRFPEINRDGANGGRAEYFLVGSLVSWVIALGGALLLWWAARTL